MSKSGRWPHHFYYRMLFVILFFSIIMFAIGFADQQTWALYHSIYFYILLAYTWFVLILLFLGEIRPDKFPGYENEKIAVLIPSYNEEPELFKQSLQSVIDAKGNKDIFVIDDGSIKGIRGETMRRLCAEKGVSLHVFGANKGKRHALHHGVSQLLAGHDFVVTIDSDTVLDSDALIRVVEPLKAENVGAATGDVQLLNENQNFVTRMEGSYYWIGLNIFKQAQSTLGLVVCCSGCLAAYRADIMTGIIDEFVNQQFRRQSCTHSEDRHLTNLVLRAGYKVKYAPMAISYTHAPDTTKGFIRQQQRWKRGFIRESTYTLTYAWRTHPILFFQILLCELTIPFFAFGLMLALVLTLISNPARSLLVLLPAWIIFMFVRYLPILFTGKRKIPGLFIYMLFYELVLYWTFIYALFTVRNRSWMTRS